METYLRCFREVLSEVKKARIQPNLDFFFQEDDSQSSTPALEVSS
jgi:hypothetical protein